MLHALQAEDDTQIRELKQTVSELRSQLESAVSDKRRLKVLLDKADEENNRLQKEVVGREIN